MRRTPIAVVIAVAAIAIAVAVAGCGDDAAPPAPTITIDTAHPGDRIPDDFLGASYETSTLLPDTDGVHYFRADNQALIRTFTTLGLHSLRLGGTESDVGPMPEPADIEALQGFAAAAHVPLIYTLRLSNHDPAAAAAIAHTMLARDAAGVTCFSIGNEANWYETYERYRDDATAYMNAIAAADARARFCAPDVFEPGWLSMFAREFGDRPDVAMVDYHTYFGGPTGTIDDPDAARASLLTLDGGALYADRIAAFVPAVHAAGLPYRLAETNSYGNGGAPGASDTFTSALWGLDYLWWFAGHGAIGVNFHTGDHVSGKTTTYSLFKSTTGGYAIHPLGYAVKAFDLAGRGRVLPVAIDHVPPEITAYALLADDGAVFVTLVDRGYGAGASAVELDLALDRARDAPHAAAVWWLAAPERDVQATTGITLGGSEIAVDATWAGAPSPLVVDADRRVRISLPPATAAVIELR